ncbi:hypothetical protein [Sphingomonas sp. PP-CE-1G-424]|uniref:hypothetical protein n=1 Tax=Sphingomonas sp. PP-CE-1G-424 TaxID=2135658 RepID=UPI001055AB69|nr:hypothetical protein [Sphingomonas sp. PP-CE-1G-424]TCP65356.1 hypothetical protein C8J43_11212 [Sphingomonas sp. PP-CE-1G-424]
MSDIVGVVMDHHSHQDVSASALFVLGVNPGGISAKYAKRGAMILVKACRALGDDVQQHVGLEAIAAGCGFHRWNELTAQLGVSADRVWSEERCRSRMIELLPGIETDVLEGALTVLATKWRPAW